MIYVLMFQPNQKRRVIFGTFNKKEVAEKEMRELKNLLEDRGHFWIMKWEDLI